MGRQRDRPRLGRVAWLFLRAEIGRLDFGVGPNGIGIAGGDDLTAVEYIDMGADLHDKRHVMFDQEHAHSFSGQLLQHLPKCARFIGVQTGAGFIEQQHPG